MNRSQAILSNMNEASDSQQSRIHGLAIDALAKFRNSNNLGSKLNYLAELVTLCIALNLARDTSVTSLVGQALATGRPHTGSLS